LTRDALLDRLVALVTARPAHPLRVAIDGPDAAGKTTLADELAGRLRQADREVIRASIDGFHRPRAERRRRGDTDPRGYYEDSFDNELVRLVLLEPLGPTGDRRYRTAAFDYRADTAVERPERIAPVNAVLVFDGVFLLRPELVDCWEVKIFVAVDLEECVRRGVARDADLFGSPAETERRYRDRYVAGQRLYFAAVRPDELADAVVVNDDPARPRLLISRG
jgi:uridine kinase